MIIHRYSDGSEGYQYEIGDRVIVERTIAGGWFDYGPTHSDHCEIISIEKNCHWYVASLEVRFSAEWGPASCNPWKVKPHAETLAKATVIDVAEAVSPSMA